MLCSEFDCSLMQKAAAADWCFVGDDGRHGELCSDCATFTKRLYDGSGLVAMVIPRAKCSALQAAPRWQNAVHDGGSGVLEPWEHVRVGVHRRID